MNYDKFIPLNKIEEKHCKGRIYRLKLNSFINSKGHIIYKEVLIPMKKLSCSGCEFCHWIDEALGEWMNYNKISPEIDNLVDNGLYILSTCHEEINYESGIVEDFDFIFEYIDD